MFFELGHASVLDHVFRPMEHHARMGTERAGGLNRGPLLFGSNLEQSVSFEFALAFGMLHPTLHLSFSSLQNGVLIV